jgi:hypothetical protein
VNQILNDFPTPDSFASVTALTNRPLPAEAAQWPTSPKLQVVSGVDLLTSKGQAGLDAELEERVKNIKEITHVYFFGMGRHPLQYTELELTCDSVHHGP